MKDKSMTIHEVATVEDDAIRWREYCRMMAEHDNEAIEEFGAMIPPGPMTKEKLDLAMDMWLGKKGEK